MRNLIIIALLALLALAAACSGGGGPAAENGSIAGTLNVVGPFNGAAELNVGVFAPGSTVPLQTAVAGRLTSVATATLSGRTITFSFTELEFGSYEVALYSQSGAVPTFYWRSDPQTISESSPSVTGLSADASLTGAAPFGSISGIVLLDEEFEFETGKLYFIGFAPPSSPQSVLQHMVSSADVNAANQLFFNVDGLAHGNWLVGFYGYDPTTHAVTTHGALDNPAVISAGVPNVTGAIFPAGATDPGADPELGSITGTVTFNGALPAGQSLHIAANTVPPQQGAPPATNEISPDDLNGGRTLDYALTGLPDGTYSVAVFSYDFTTHTATYFGTLEGSVAVAGSNVVADADFTADVTVIGGTAD